MNEETVHKRFTYSVEEDEILLLRARDLAESVDEFRKNSRSLLSFRIAEQVFGLQTKDVIQVVSSAEVLKIPQAPKVVIGVANIRGEIVAVFDTSVLLTGKPLLDKKTLYLLLIKQKEHFLCFAIAQPPESILAEETDIETPGRDDTNRNRELIEAYVRYGNEVVQLLSAEKLFTHKHVSKLLSSNVE